MILIDKASFAGRQSEDNEEDKMSNSVYRVTELVGTSEKSWEDAATVAIESASHALKNLRVAEITKLDMKIEDGKVTAYRTRVQLSFKYEEHPISN